jgi:Protein of unknown function (DUF3108)
MLAGSMSLLLVPLAAMALASPTECGLPALRSGGPPWAPGESLAYDMEVMGVVKAGALSIDVQEPMFGGAQIPVRARFRNTSVFAKIRKVRATAVAWVDARTLRPERYREDAVVNGVIKTTDARFPPPPAEVTIEIQSGADKKTERRTPQGEAMDLLTAIYYLRAAALHPGQEICLDLVANWRYWHLVGKVAAKPERVESAAGIFDTIRVDATVARADPGAPSRPLHLWISTDSRHLLVAAVSEVDLGPVSAMLTRAGR